MRPSSPKPSSQKVLNIERQVPQISARRGTQQILLANRARWRLTALATVTSQAMKKCPCGALLGQLPSRTRRKRPAAMRWSNAVFHDIAFTFLEGEVTNAANPD